MTDLRKAAEMALEFVEWLCGDDHSVKPKNNALKTKQALRQALAQPDEVLAEREACAKLCDDICLKYSKADDYAERVASQWCAEAIRARSEKRPVKSYCGGKPNYCTPEVTPDVDTVNTSQARVEYDRQGNIARLFGPIEPDGTLLYTAPPKRECVDAVNMSQERVDETAKHEHEPVAWLIQYKTRHDIMWGSTPGLRSNDQILGMEPLYTAPPKREWVGLTVDEARKFYEKYTDREELIYAIDKFLEDKNA